MRIMTPKRQDNEIDKKYVLIDKKAGRGSLRIIQDELKCLIEQVSLINQVYFPSDIDEF